MKVNLQLIAIAFVILVAVTNGKECQIAVKSEGKSKTGIYEWIS